MASKIETFEDFFLDVELYLTKNKIDLEVRFKQKLDLDEPICFDCVDKLNLINSTLTKIETGNRLIKEVRHV